MTNKRKRKHWWQNIKFKYRLTIVNENTLEEVVTLYVSKLNGLSVIFSVLTLLCLLTALLMIYTPLRNYLPGYMSNQLRATIVDNRLMADSLDEIVGRHQLYIQNIQDILAGKISSDTVQSIDSLTVMRSDQLTEATERERDFRRQYEEAERYNLTATATVQADTEGTVLYSPTRGMLTSAFDPENRHYGVDIAANPSECIMAVLDGTVIWSTYSTQTGYVIALQHRKGLVTVYKHCGSLLKAEGEQVKAGESIALVGNTGVETTGPHLHFELWNKGQPVNPERYIIF